MRKMIVKMHNLQGRKILAICDKDVLGKRYLSGKKQLDISSPFYSGIEIPEADIMSMIKEVYTVNAVGEKSVRLLKKIKIVSKKNVGRIKGIPYASAVLE